MTRLRNWKVMFDRMDPQKGKRSTVHGAQQHVGDFGVVGLRTLVMARRILTPEQTEEYVERYQTAKAAVFNRDQQLAEVADDFEKDLEILGCSGLEDRIQAGVSTAVNTLLRGGIKLWMLTGDKQETAINVGYAISLFKSNFRVFTVNISSASSLGRSEDLFFDVVYRIEAYREDCRLTGRESEYGLVIDGGSAGILLGNAAVTEDLVKVTANAAAVIACRITPKQKSALVSLIKANLVPTPMTLAIGDGANDVAMIRTAHVGVGITGNEGRQAVSASDYSIGQFRFLVNLLLIHGRQNYNRVCTVILFSFFKNICLLIPVFHYNRFNGFSGASLYESYILMSFNLLWTSFPVLYHRDFSSSATAVLRQCHCFME